MIYFIQKVKENTYKTRKEEKTMAKISKNVVDADLRATVFGELDIENGNFVKVNDRQYGIILTDKNGVERYCRVGVIVAEEREDMTARELMEQEIATYNEKQASKAAKAAERAKKAEADKARREAKAKEEA